MIFLPLAALALLQQPSPLVRAESLLVQGDTAAAIRVLARVPFDPVVINDEALRATFALDWIGRSPTRHDARDLWRTRARRFSRPAQRSGVTLALALMMDWERRDVEHRLNEADAASDTLWEEAEGEWGSSDVSAAALRWVAVATDLDQVSRRLALAVPRLASPPPECSVFVLLRESCDLARPPDRLARPLGTMAAADDSVALRLGRMRRALDANAGAPWPFGELAARAAVALEVLFGDSVSRVTLQRGLRGDVLTRTLLDQSSVVLFAFSGMRDSAAAIAERDSTAFAFLDSTIHDLDVARRRPVRTVSGVVTGHAGSTAIASWRLARPLFLEPYNERLLVHRVRELVAHDWRLVLQPGNWLLTAYARPAAFIRRGLPVAVAAIGGFDREGKEEGILISYFDRRVAETVQFQASGSPANADMQVALAAVDPSAGRSMSGYIAQSYDSIIGYLPNQVVRYRRDGVTHVDFFAQPVKPLEGHRTPACENSRAVTGFFLMSPGLQPLMQAVDTLPAGFTPIVRFRTELRPGVYRVSLEDRDLACRVAARARFRLDVPDTLPGMTMSDVVLADEVRVTAPVRVRGDLPVVARPAVAVAAGEDVHLYWEVYGVREDSANVGDRLAIDMKAVDLADRRVALDGLARVQQAADFSRPVVALSYTEPVPPGTGPLGMSLKFRMPGDNGGVHLVRITVVDRATGDSASAIRPFNVTWGNPR